MRYTAAVLLLFVLCAPGAPFCIAQNSVSGKSLQPEYGARSVTLDPSRYRPLNPTPDGDLHPVFQDREVSAGKAFALSLLFPGLGHRYVHDGSWRGWATVFAVADIGLWTSLAGSEWRRGHLIRNYQTLAALGAGAETAGKDRDFFLHMASYRSSDEYLATQLRSRNWTNLDYVADPSFQWIWESDEDFERYRELREDSETLRRRRSFLITTLVANRLIAGVAALRGARRANGSTASLSLTVPPTGSHAPLIHFRWRW